MTGPYAPERLAILVVEDRADDAELEMRALARGGVEVAHWERVETADELRRALADRAWDVVLCDHVMPGFSSGAALELLASHEPEIPCVVVSGAIGEEATVDVLHAGASDWVMKDSLDRLPQVVRRTLERSRERQARIDAERRLEASERRYRQIVETANEGVWLVDADGRTTFANGRLGELLGYSPEALAGRHLADLHASPADARAAFEAGLWCSRGHHETVLRRADGSEVHVEISTAGVDDGKEGGGAALAMVIDLTERIEAERGQAELQDRMHQLDRLDTVERLAAASPTSSTTCSR